MKINKKHNKATTKVAATATTKAKAPVTGLTVSEPVVSIGSRGTAMLTCKQLPSGVKFGENAQLPKSGHDEATAPWLLVRSWISPRPLPFTLLPLKQAVKQGLVKVLTGVKFRLLDGKTYTASAVLPKKWTPAEKIPQSVAVFNVSPKSLVGTLHGRVEARKVNENPDQTGQRPAARNIDRVGTFLNLAELAK